MDTQEQSVCPNCGHVNDRSWILCDTCGARLPWAPLEKPKVKPSELTDEQLALMSAPIEKKELFYLLTPEGKQVLYLIVFVVAFIWVFILGR